jgi:hypothetical protein
LMGRLVIAFGVILSGSAWGAPQVAEMSMLGMQMPMPAMPGKDMPARNMPCHDRDCGCCIGGTCAAPVPCQSSLAPSPVRLSNTAFHRTAILTGITFPPDIRPPIARPA